MAIPLLRTIGDVRPPRQNFLNRFLHKRLTQFFIFSAEANLIRYVSCWPDLESRSTVIHGGINPDVFYTREKNRDLIKKLGLDDHKILLGQIGRLSAVKDYPTTIKAMALLIEDHQDIHLIISGIEGKVKVDRLKELAFNYNIEPNITFIGPYDPVADLISILDIGIVASRGSEAICRIAMEYLAMGIPVVATDVNVLPEIIVNRRNGIIVHAEDPVGMAEALTELISNADLRRQIRQNNLNDGRSRLNILSAAGQTIDIYTSVLRSNK